MRKLLICRLVALFTASEDRPPNPSGVASITGIDAHGLGRPPVSARAKMRKARSLRRCLCNSSNAHCQPKPTFGLPARFGRVGLPPRSFRPNSEPGVATIILLGSFVRGHDTVGRPAPTQPSADLPHHRRLVVRLRRGQPARVAVDERSAREPRIDRVGPLVLLSRSGGSVPGSPMVDAAARSARGGAGHAPVRTDPGVLPMGGRAGRLDCVALAQRGGQRRAWCRSKPWSAAMPSRDRRHAISRSTAWP